MKKFLLSLGFLAVCGMGYLLADNTADLNTMNEGKAATAYSTYKSTDGWTATNSALLKIGDDLTVVLNGKTSAVGTLTSPTLTGGIGTLSFNYENNYSETNGVSVRIDIKQNDNVVATQTLTKGKNDVEQGTVYSFTSDNFNVSGDFTIEITNLSPSNSTSNKDRVSIWNISWTSLDGEGGGGTETPEPDPDPVDPPTGDDDTTVAFYATSSYTGTASITTQIGTGSGTLQIAGNESTATKFTAGDITIWIEKVNSSVSQANGEQVRWYQNDKLHIIPANGAIITNVNFTATQGAFTASTGTVDGYTWTGSTDQELILTTTSQVRFSVMDVTYVTGEAPAVAAPKISCADNVVTINCETEGAEIYYTLDGTDPTQSSTKYADPFAITENLTVKAIAYKDGEASSIATYNAVYVGHYSGFEALVNEGANAEGTVDGPITVVYQNGQYLYVVDSSNYPMLVYGSVNATLTNGQTLSEISGKYSPYSGLPELTNPKLGTVGTGTPVEPQTITDAVNDALINTYVLFNNVTIDANKNMTYGDNTIVLYSRFTDVDLPTDYTKNYNVTGFVSTYNGTLQVYPTAFEEVTNVSQVATPVISPNGGAVVENTEVTITCETDGASIYYTLDGTEPSEAANLYQAPIVITEAVTIKAIAVKEGMTDSYVATAEFTVIDPNAKNGTFDFTDPTSLSTPITPSENVSEGVNLEYGVPFTSNAVTLTFDKGKATTDSRIWTANQGVQLRIYTNSTFTISVPEKTMIKSVEIAYVSGNFGLTPSVGVLSEANPAIWTPSETATLAADETGVREITFTVTKTSYIQSITVNYDVSTGVEAIEAINDGEAVYYNLQGVKVNNPERGIFVKVQNGKAVKVVK